MTRLIIENYHMSIKFKIQLPWKHIQNTRCTRNIFTLITRLDSWVTSGKCLIQAHNVNKFAKWCKIICIAVQNYKNWKCLILFPLCNLSSYMYIVYIDTVLYISKKLFNINLYVQIPIKRSRLISQPRFIYDNNFGSRRKKRRDNMLHIIESNSYIFLVWIYIHLSFVKYESRAVF